MNELKVKLFSEYLRYEEINEYLEWLAKQYSNLVEVKTVGYSYEGRAIKIIQIENKIDKLPNKKCIFIDGGTHAREWITISTTLFVIYSLVEQFNDNSILLSNFIWIILPVVNPDGYEFSHEKNRLWRKTRKPNLDNSCIGTDCNRNYDFQWGKGCKNPCHVTYCGAYPFSEPETIAVKEIMTSALPNLEMYISLHSHAQAILYPWGFKKTPPKQWQLLHKLGSIGQQAIKNCTGTKYRLGSVSSVMYIACGGSIDYAYGCLKIPYVYCMELPSGGRGFDPPKPQIIKIVKESWIGIKAMALHVKSKNTINIKIPSMTPSETDLNKTTVKTRKIRSRSRSKSNIRKVQ